MLPSLEKTPIFLVSLYQLYIENIDLSSIQEHVKLIGHKKHNRSGINSYQSGFIIDQFDNDIVKDVFEQYIFPLSKQIIRDQWAYTKTPNRFEYWYNINYKNSYNIQHNHVGSLLSGVFYVKVPKNSGNIVFLRNEAEVNELSKNVGHNTSLDSNCNYWVEAKENKLIMFPSYISHYVQQSQADDDRISVSFNIME